VSGTLELLEVAAPLLVGGAGAGYAKIRAPRAYWATIGLPVTLARIGHSYADVMEACRLTREPPLWKVMAARAAGAKSLRPVPPRIVRITPTATGVRLRLRLAKGQDTPDIADMAGRLRHAWSVQAVRVSEIGPRVVELHITGYDVLRNVRMPARSVARSSGLLRVPAAVREDGGVFVRDFRAMPNGLTIGATGSGKSMYARNLIAGLAAQPVALVGIDCKRGVEQAPFAARLSALATDPDTAVDLLRVLVGTEMERRYDLVRERLGVSGRVAAEDVAVDVWGLPEEVRPAPLVMVIDEIAELFLAATKAEEARRNELVTLLVRYAQLGRAAGMFVEVMGQRFGADLGKGATALRAQLTSRIVHRVNDTATAEMALGDLAKPATEAAALISPDRAGTAVAADQSGAWVRIRTPRRDLGDTARHCTAFAHLVPDLPALETFRPVPVTTPADALPVPATVSLVGGGT